MASIGPRLAWRQKLRIHFKAILQALPVSLLIVGEGKDLYYRATWEVTEIQPSEFSTGDIVTICNRWYTLPTWNHKCYSLLSKVLLKSTWDDVGVIWMKNGVPYIFFCDFEGAKVLSMDEFIQTRLPRGMAVRKLLIDEPSLSRRPTSSVAALFSTEVQKLTPHPWYLFSASLRHGNENKYYEFMLEMSRERYRIYEMRKRKTSSLAVKNQEEKLKEMEEMRQHLSTFVKHDGNFRLFNGSMAASFLATFDLLDRNLPPPSRYVPQDFAHDLPFKCLAKLEEPVVFFKN
ncbi:uncharacterized protein TM35_000042110 [Trypanosoma theileri]|uniref:Uncharacterized protein n=1 Tax=Trypanosoma theileri TaxID=67003 RepID=A0A1X0P4X8_9TRYP|nr:uncharacterized protein TM35_000042110 [Trypanosoma theileri]ORC91997.1 hypothetical protein TM35_000042110 [Trypanosoma theileri]